MVKSKYGSLRYHLDEALNELKQAVSEADPLETYFPHLVEALRTVARVAEAAPPEQEEEES